MNVRDRIQRLRRVKASRLRRHPKNWRTYPVAQQDAVRGQLARELDDGSLELIDGHLRAEITPDAEVPVLVVDLGDREAAKLLALHDPLAELARGFSRPWAPRCGPTPTCCSSTRTSSTAWPSSTSVIGPNTAKAKGI